LADLHVLPDLSFKPAHPSDLRFVHRELSDGELYFVSSAADTSLELEASFRVTGKLPEIWRADTGGISQAAYRFEDERTMVPLHLDAHEAVFVMFRQVASAPSETLDRPSPEVLAALDGPWEVTFPSGLGAPAHVRLETLNSWTESSDPGIRYFSGTATYKQAMRIDNRWRSHGAHIVLELGSVRNIAEVRVNGHELGLLWKAPFDIDITDALKSGDNQIEIKVTNLWPNRLVGDQQPGARQVAAAPHNPFKADSPLLPSGLLGPVVLRTCGVANLAAKSASSDERYDISNCFGQVARGWQ
jgi:hypothetical protein